MSKKMKRFLTILALLLSAAWADARPAVSLGGWLSPKGSGVVFYFSHTDGSYGELRINADFERLLNGSKSSPGIQAQYWYNIPLTTIKVSDAFKIRPTAGPGVSLGYVRDYEKDMGLVVAAGGNLGLEFIFPSSPLSLYAGVSAEVGAHIVLGGRNNSPVTLYTNGLRRAWQPEIAFRYRF